MSVIEDVTTLRNLLSSPDRWTKSALARTFNDKIVYPIESPEAVKWCLIGAIHIVAGSFFSPRSEAMFNAINPVLPRGDIVRWNNDKKRKHSDIINLLDMVIENQSEVKEKVLEDA